MRRNNQKGIAGLVLLGVVSLVCIFGTGSQISFGSNSNNNMSKSHVIGESRDVDSAISWLKGEDLRRN